MNAIVTPCSLSRAAPWQIFYSYGSDKPFEHILKTLQAQQQQQRKGDRNAILEGNPEGCKLVWVTHEESPI